MAGDGFNIPDGLTHPDIAELRAQLRKERQERLAVDKRLCDLVGYLGIALGTTPRPSGVHVGPIVPMPGDDFAQKWAEFSLRTAREWAAFSLLMARERAAFSLLMARRMRLMRWAFGAFVLVIVAFDLLIWFVPRPH